MPTSSGTVSALLLSSDNIEFITDAGEFTRADITSSDLFLATDNLDFVISGEELARIAIADSDLLLTSDNVDYLVKGTSLIPPINTKLRQIYSDGTHVYGATNKGLVVFKL